MIGWLSGQVVHRHGADGIVIDVGGVGYEVRVAAAQDFRPGEAVEVFVVTVVRDDAIVLYGFRNYEEREFFELLLVTPGVGPSTALGALRTMSIAELASAIENDDPKRIAQIHGIGPKTAARIVLELKGKVTSTESAVVPPSPLRSSVIDDALRQLGYSGFEIRSALADVALPEDESAALREALHRLRRQ